MEHNSGGLNKKKKITTHVLYEIDFMLNNSCFLAEIYVQWNVSIKYNNLNWVKVTQLAEQIFYTITYVDIFMYIMR